MKTRIFTASAIVAILLLVVSCSTMHLLQPNKSGEFQVIRVIDGDTISISLHCDIGPTVAKVRLLGIQAPERRQPGYIEAKNGLIDLLKNPAGKYKKVRLVFDKPGQKDAFGRFLAYVHVAGIDCGEDLLRRDLVSVYEKYPCKRTARYLEVQNVR